MKKAILIGLVFVAMTVAAAKPAEAIWPFAAPKAEEKQADDSLAARWRELRQEMHEWRSQWREARKEALADFLDLKREESAQKSVADETSQAIAEEQGLAIVQRRETHQETRRENWEEAGFNEIEIAEKEARVQERQQEENCQGEQAGDGETARLGRGW